MIKAVLTGMYVLFIIVILFAVVSLGTLIADEIRKRRWRR